MFPTDDYVTTIGIMAVLSKITATILEFNPYTLPLIMFTIHPPFRFTIWIAGSDCFNNKTKLRTDHAKEKNHSLFIDRSVL